MDASIKAEGQRTVGKAKLTTFYGIERAFAWIAAGILLSTSLAKLFSAFGHPNAVSHRDPVFIFLTQEQVLLSAAIVELATAAALLWLEPVIRLVPLGCLSAVFLIYKMSLSWLNVPLHQCPCLGIPEGWSTLDKMVLGVIANAMLIFLLSGSFGILFWNQLRHRIKEK